MEREHGDGGSGDGGSLEGCDREQGGRGHDAPREGSGWRMSPSMENARSGAEDVAGADLRETAGIAGDRGGGGCRWACRQNCAPILNVDAYNRYLRSSRDVGTKKISHAQYIISVIIKNETLPANETQAF
jgi:hypothetical protein